MRVRSLRLRWEEPLQVGQVLSHSLWPMMEMRSMYGMTLGQPEMTSASSPSMTMLRAFWFCEPITV